MKHKPTTAALSLLLLTASCAGTRTVGDRNLVHAEAFNLFGWQFPHDDQAAAWSRVPEGADVHTVTTSPRDWSSVLGVLNNLFWFTGTQIEWSGGEPIQGN